MIQDTFSGRVFVLGAGFSHHISGGYLPLLKQLAQRVAEEVPWVRQYSENGTNPDLERALTELDLEFERARDEHERKRLRRRRSQIARAIARCLSLKGMKRRSLNLAKKRVAPVFMPGDYILTFNWDCLLESLLWQAGAWTPSDGYGWSLSVPRSASDDGLNPLFVRVLKLHGSVNFVTSSYDGEHLEILPVPSGFGGSSDLDPPQERDVTPVLALPTYIKTFGEERSSVHIWMEATEALSYAKVLIVIGYSFPRADAMARYLFAFAGSTDPLRRAAVVARTLRECRAIKEQIHSVATLERNVRSAEEQVDWALFPACRSGAYRRLCEKLQEWPCRDLSAQIAQQAAFPEHLRRIVALREGKGFFGT